MERYGFIIMITIKEMANMLGISTTTVSNVIHGKTGEVSRSTVEKVEKLLKEYEYVPNFNARNLASNKSGLIGVAIVSKENDKNYLQDAYVSEFVGTIERELKKYGYFLMMYFADNAEEIVKIADSWNVEGMIMSGMRREDCQLTNKRFKKPIIFMDSYIDDILINGVNIGLDDRKGGYLMTKYLIEMGHRNIAFLADNFYGVDYERYRGFAAAMSEARYPVGQDNFIRIGAGEEDLKKSLEEIYLIHKAYTALFVASDYYAMRIMNYLFEQGVKVPEDISIAGFDNNIYSRFTRPPITTVHQSPTRKGELAVENLMKQIRGEAIETNWIVLPVELVIRNTVRNLNE